MNANDKQFLTKGKEYVIDKIEGQYITIKSDLYDEHVFKDTKINESFTIKRYTLSYLQTRTDIMVRIDNEEQAKKLQDAGLDFVYDSSERYYGYTSKESCFIFLNLDEMKSRILLESIDEIDLGEGKEEVLTTPVKVRTVEFLENLVREYESEIARLKREVQNWKDSYNGLFRRSEELEKSTPLAVLESTTDLEKRERMAWEIWLQGRYTVEQAIEKVNHFLEESKEVGNG